MTDLLENKVPLPLAAILSGLALVVGFGIGTTYIKRECEKNNMFYDKDTETVYYCATEQQLKKLNGTHDSQ